MPPKEQLCETCPINGVAWDVNSRAHMVTGLRLVQRKLIAPDAIEQGGFSPEQADAIRECSELICEKGGSNKQGC